MTVYELYSDLIAMNLEIAGAAKSNADLMEKLAAHKRKLAEMCLKEANDYAATRDALSVEDAGKEVDA